MAAHFPAQTVATFLSQTSLLKSCQLHEVIALAEGSAQKAFPAGTTIIGAGHRVDALGLLLRGRAALYVMDAAQGTRSRLMPILPGDPFGEVGLLLKSGGPLAVIAEEDSHSIFVPREELIALFSTAPTISIEIARRVSSQLVQVSSLGLQEATQHLSAGSTAPAAQTTPTADPPADQIAFVEIADYQITPEVLGTLPVALIRKHRTLPLQLKDNVLTIGMVNPRSVAALQEIRRVLHTVDPKVVAISDDDYNQAFVRYRLDPAAGVQGATALKDACVVYAADQRKQAGKKGPLIVGDEVISLLDRILIEGSESGASDIHIEPASSGIRVRYRIQGSMTDRKEAIAGSYLAPLMTRIKVVADLDITDRRQPQDGRIVAQVGRNDLNLRVSTMGVSRGEKAVIRIIDPTSVMRPLNQIFGHPAILQVARKALSEPHGSVMVAGPTGSGKSSTLYSLLNERRLGRPDTNIVAVEDPVEFLLPAVTQVSVNERANLDFATILRGLMRQDPDVIMIGELRDADTAGIMIEAALTGHLVLTSTHGNDCTGVLQRMQHLGSSSVLLSQALNLVVVQRLVRKLCAECAGEAHTSASIMESLMSRGIVERGGATKLPQPRGCPACRQSGFAGRLPVHEVLHFGDEVRSALAASAKPAELLLHAAEHGDFISAAESAKYLMARGLLAPSEALMAVSS